jgi:CBS domain-containing protein
MNEWNEHWTATENVAEADMPGEVQAVSTTEIDAMAVLVEDGALTILTPEIDAMALLETVPGDTATTQTDAMALPEPETAGTEPTKPTEPDATATLLEEATVDTVTTEAESIATMADGALTNGENGVGDVSMVMEGNMTDSVDAATDATDATDATASSTSDNAIDAAACRESDGEGVSDTLFHEMVKDLSASSTRDTPLRRHRKQPRSSADVHEAATPMGRQAVVLAPIVTPTDTTIEAVLQTMPSHDVTAVPAEDDTEPVPGTVASDATDTPSDDADWRQAWPRNELLIFGQLEALVSQAPTVDGVTRIRAAVEIMEIDDASGATGVIAKVPVQILPVARGFEPLFKEITRAREQRRRLRPFSVELRGASKRLQDKDGRYAHTRWTTLFGLEVSRVTRVEHNVAHYGRWRGTGMVIAARPFAIGNEEYFRITLRVAAGIQKAHLRGVSSALDQVDVLVRAEHEHAPRFRHVGQRLLVEAEVCSQISVLGAAHPDLEGLDDDAKERLRILREGILLVTMGEFPDERAEADFGAWDAAERPGPPGRPGYRLSPSEQRVLQQRLREERRRERAASSASAIADSA